jgi:class 3 adenylate cyclase/pimeloyl-ACP methyl ester carboxylesterase
VGLDIRYAQSGGVAIAYQVVGNGETDLVLVPDYASNLVFLWETPYYRPFYERLAQSFRLILFDKRGTGLSDRGASFPTLETRMEDVHAVMDAAGSRRAVIFGQHEGCLMATLFAATYPESTIALALFHPSYHDSRVKETEEELRRLREGWGTQEWCDELLELIGPSLAVSEEARHWFANEIRVGASPAMAYELNRAFDETDLRDVYAAVRVPALVLYRDTPLALDESLAVATAIPGARAMRVSGTDYWGFFLSFDIADELERLAAGESAPAVPDSVLTTLLFTDIVGSTMRAAELGDRAWRDLLARHNAAVRRELARFRGEERDTAGDGFFATFDGPARAIRCAQAILESVRPLGLYLRAGIHTGECELHEGKVAGVALSIGARVCSVAGDGEVLVSRTVKDLVAGSGLAFDDRGRRELKDVGEWELYAVA